MCPLVSIVTPCLNSAPFVRQAVESAMAQTWGNTEIILVDNGSSDGTLEILQGLAEQYPEQIRVFREARRGPSAARNRGLAEANGDFVQFLDSDDILLPGKISRQMEIGLKGSADLVVGNYLLVTGKKQKKIRAHRNPWAGLATSRLGITSSLLWKRELLMRAGMFDENWLSSDEYHTMFRVMKMNARVAYDTGFNTIVLWRDESVSKSLDPTRQEAIWDTSFRLRFEMRDYLQAQGLFGGEIKFAWENYMYSHLVHRKYHFPSLYKKYVPLIRHNLPLFYVVKPVLGREVRGVLRKVFRAGV